MTETRTLTDPDEIRGWAAARSGIPAMVEQPAMPGSDMAPVLTIVFGQPAYQDQDSGPDRPPGMGGYEMVEWDQWMELFESQELALVVAKDEPGRLDSFFELVRRPGRSG